jgi:hypothetical protein
MKLVTNTANQDSSVILLEAMLNPSGHIEAQEARGQQELVDSDVLPVNRDKQTQEGLEKMGVIFQELIDEDPLFQIVTLPNGWKKVTTEHSMWSNLVDDKGTVVAKIFYKAAFYDRKAALYIETKER